MDPLTKAPADVTCSEVRPAGGVSLMRARTYACSSIPITDLSSKGVQKVALNAEDHAGLGAFTGEDQPADPP